MKPDDKMLEAAAEKAREQSIALTEWARKKFGLAPEYQITVRLALSIKQVKPRKTTISFQGLTFDQQPTLEDWDKVIKLVEGLYAKAKPYKSSKGMWRQMIPDLKRLRKSKNVAYVGNATPLNLYLQRHGLPYRLMRADGPGDDTLYSLLTTKPILSHTP